MAPQARQLTSWLLAAAGIVMLLTYLCALWLMPAGQRALRDIHSLMRRADLANRDELALNE